jgi:proteasome lid subunit RPN8/RPN11
VQDRELIPLLDKFSEGLERGGVILSDGTLVELPNNAEDPSFGYFTDVANLEPYEDDLWATWHTHPGATANLSVEDNETFVQWPDLLHAIVGTDGVRWYQVRKGAVLNA